MKTKLLLIYGYLIPFIGSALVSALPWIFGFIRYEEIAVHFSSKSELLFAFLAVIGGITIPFQTAIINEDNPHVLAVLEKSKVRSVFIGTSIFQAVLIVCLSLLILILVTKNDPSSLYGYLELLALSIITFESIALISNGRAYSSIRERIITAATKALQKNSSQNGDF